MNEKWKKTTEESRKKGKEAKKGTAENKRVDNKRKNNNKRQQRETSKRWVWTRTSEEMRKQEGGKKLLENKWWAKKRGETQRQEGRMRKNKNREQDRCRQREQMKERRNAVQICRKNTQGSNTITTWSQQSFFSPHTPACTVVTCLLVIHVSSEMIPPLLGLKKTVIIFLGGGGLISSHFLLCSPSSGPSLLLIPVFKLPSILQSWGASQIAFVHLLTTRPRDRVCVCVCRFACMYVWRESVAAGWWVEITVIMGCYLFIKHTVGTLLTAFRNQLKQNKLLTLAALARGVYACVWVRKRKKKRVTTIQYASVSITCKGLCD